MIEFTAIENILILTKLASLPTFKLLNFSWTLTSPHTYRHIHSAREQMHTSVLCTFKLPHTHTHTHIYISKTCYLLTSCIIDKLVYTQICLNNTHLHLHSICIKHTQIPNKHIHTFTTLYHHFFIYFML